MKTSLATACWRHFASLDVIASAKRNATPFATATRTGTSRLRSGRPTRSRRPEEPEAVAALDWDLDNLRATHVWSIEQGDTDVALRLVAPCGNTPFGACACRAHQLGGRRAQLPDAERHERYPVVLAVAAYGRFSRRRPRRRDRTRRARVTATERFGHGSSGLAERGLGNAWFYRGDAVEACAWIDRVLESAGRVHPRGLRTGSTCDRLPQRVWVTTSWVPSSPMRRSRSRRPASRPPLSPRRTTRSVSLVRRPIPLRPQAISNVRSS